MDKNNKILLYTTVDGKQKLEVNLQDDTVWLSLDQIADLFQRNKSTISRHIKNIFEEGELQHEATVANFATVQKEGEREIERNIEYYNLDYSLVSAIFALRKSYFIGKCWKYTH